MVPRRKGSLQGKAPVKPEDLTMGEKCPQECQLTWDQLKGRTWPVLLAPGAGRPLGLEKECSDQRRTQPTVKAGPGAAAPHLCSASYWEPVPATRTQASTA